VRWRVGFGGCVRIGRRAKACQGEGWLVGKGRPNLFGVIGVESDTAVYEAPFHVFVVVGAHI